MIRLTVLYNLPAGASESEFIAWRMSTHADYVKNMPGVVRTDFARIQEISPSSAAPAYRFQTTVDWPDYESYAAAFLNDEAQDNLKADQTRIGEQIFIVSEVLSN